MRYWQVLLLSIGFCIQINAFTLKRALVASDTNPMYIDFWPLVAKAWKKLGLQPTLALIAPPDFNVDTTCGDVIRFDPIHGIPTSFQAQVIRLLAPAYFPHDETVIADIDLIPLPGAKEFLFKSVKKYMNNVFIIYCSAYYGPQERYPMTYVGGLGSTFKDIFQIGHLDEIPDIIRCWYELGFGWDTDEVLLYRYCAAWKHFGKRCIRIPRVVEFRIDRLNWHYNKRRLNYYIDAHLPRPYSEHRQSINKLARRAGITI